MKKSIKLITLTTIILFLFSTSVLAQDLTHTVKWGDSLWKIAVRYQIGLSEIITANPQIKNPDLIYPGQKITVPNIDDIKAIENRVVQLVNQERAKQGLPALTNHWELSRVARYKSVDMRDKGYFSHTSPTYGSPFTMMQNFGIRYSAAGENIAKGQPTPERVMNDWMNSPGHRSNILSSSFSHIGVGVAKDKAGNYYWTQMFIRPTNR